MLRLLYLLYWLVFAGPVFLLLTILTALSTTIGSLLGYSRIFAYYPGRYWSKATLLIALCPIKVKGKEHLPDRKGAYVVMANHQGAFDIFMMYGYLGLPFKWVLKEGIRKIPLVGKACEAAGFIYVDEKKPSSIQRTISDAQRVLSEGSSIFIFPEGSRSKTGRMSRFKKGGFVMASALNAPIIPISLDGSFDALPTGKIIPRPRRLTLTVHPALMISDFGEPPMNIQYAARRTQEIIGSSIKAEIIAKQASAESKNSQQESEQ